LVQASDANCLPWDLFYYTPRGESSAGQTCGGAGGGGLTSFFNHYVNGLPLTETGSVTWNNLMAVPLAAPGANNLQATWTYGTDGRLKSEAQPYPFFSPPATVSTTRTYDAENHLDVTTFESPAPSPSLWPYAQVTWGPDGHPAVIGTSQNGNAPKNERLHWSGDQLLFTTNTSSGSLALDDIKVDIQGDILPSDSYSGLTFYDRGPGMILGCHNYTGTSYAGFSNAGWGGIGLSPCQVNLNPANAKMPTSIVWGGSPYGAFSMMSRKML